jgi:hypothetical protein
MVTGKMFRMALDKFFQAPVAQEARVQICMPDGQMYDIKDIKLMENKLFGVRETHRLQKALGPLSIKLYGGSQIEDLISGFAEPLSTGLENIFAFLKKI